MAYEIRQSFLNGINRRSTREDSTKPEFFYTLQNMRPLQRGRTGELVRIDGFSEFSATIDGTPIDFIAYDNLFILLSSLTATTFRVRIFDENGSSIFTQLYTDTTTSVGKLTRIENTVYISPHNRILYNDSGTWYLRDYISQIPKVSNAQALSGGTAATGNLTVGTVPTPTAKSGQANIVVSRNNTPKDVIDTITVTIEGVGTTPTFNISYTDSIETIAQNLSTAINTIPGYTATATNAFVTVTHDAGGAAHNGTNITFDSEYQVVEEEDIDANSDYFVEEGIEGKIRIFDNLATTFRTYRFIGGEDATNEIGSIVINIPAVSAEVIVKDIDLGQLNTAMATNIEAALSQVKEISDNYTTAISTNTILFTAKKNTSDLNTEINIRFADEDQALRYEQFITSAGISGGVDPSVNGVLEADEYYWYTARAVYLDGHTTKLAEPFLVKTETVQQVQITFDLTGIRDLVSTEYPKLQIYRKKGAEPFFLIEEVVPNSDTYNWTDIGETPTGEVQDDNIIWIKEKQTQEVIDNRYIIGNIKYFDETYDVTGLFTVGKSAAADGDDALPLKSRVEVYVRPQYTDGTKGFHAKIGETDTTDVLEKLTVSQSGAITPTEKTISELGIFARYSKKSTKNKIPLNTVEIANRNLYTIEDDALYPAQTRVFAGFRYIEVGANTDILIKGTYYNATRAAGWNSGDKVDGHLLPFTYQNFASYAGSYPTGAPDIIEVEIFGIKQNYLRVGYRADGGGFSAVYEWELARVLEKAVETQDLYVNISNIPYDNISGEFTNDELKQTRTKVIGIIDESKNYKRITERRNIIHGPFDSRMYLMLDDGPLDTINNPSINRYDLRQNYDSGFIKPSKSNTYLNPSFIDNENDIGLISLELTSLEKSGDPSLSAYTGADNDTFGGKKFNSYYTYNWDYTDVYTLYNTKDLIDSEQLIYLGKKANSASAVDFINSGYVLNTNEVLNYPQIHKHNIYATLVTEEDIRIHKNEYPNQLIWSEPIVTGSRFSGGRTIFNTNYFNIDSNNGPIVDMVNLGGALMVFCERGVALVNTGETLATQKSGEVYVQSSQFVTNYQWLMENMNDIKVNSIVKHLNAVYFTDGFDVFRIQQGGMVNITEGILDIDPSNDYAASIDSMHDEYRLTDLTNSQTYVFNTKADIWYGPHTYAVTFGAFYQNLNIGINASDNKLVIMNDGNDFDGTTFTSIAQAVANDTENGHFDKIFRRLYADVENPGTTTRIRYGVDETDLYQLNFETLNDWQVRSGHYNIGVKHDRTRGKQMFWEIESQEPDFSFTGFSTLYDLNRRR